MKGLPLVLAAALVVPLRAASWTVARTPHFEVWSDAAADATRTLAGGLERLRTFFVRQIGIVPPQTVRVVCFASQPEFADYRTEAVADGFALTGPDGLYMVLHTGRGDKLRVPAHEFAHLVIHSSGWKLPGWLAEGIGEVVSTVRFGERYSFIGGDLPGRSHQLKRTPWMTPAELFATAPGSDADPARGSLYYAESWAVTEMLALSAEYATRFPALVAMLNQGSESRAAIEGVYHVTPDALFSLARERVQRGMAALPLPPVEEAGAPVVETASPFEARLMLAALRHATGQTERALAQYRELAAGNPRDARVPAALGTIALEREDTAEAVRQWRRAFSLGIEDAELCYRFATLADEQGVATPEVRAALERTVELKPDFDDARFRLGLMDLNAGRAAAALVRFQAMRRPAPDRAWRYYNALSLALLDLGRRGEAKQAAQEADRAATTETEHRRARDTAYMADTRLTVEIARGADGQPAFRTVRVPVDAAPRNPFIEAGDDTRTAEGRLERVECPDSGGIRLVVRTADGRLTLVLPDPSRVQIRGGGGVKFELVCGPQRNRPVLVEYTATGILRGLEFR